MNFYSFYLIIYFILFNIYNCDSQTDTLFCENYYNNVLKWPVYNLNENKSEIKDGYYCWKHKSEGSNSLWINTKISSRADFIIEIKFNVVKDGNYGIIWGAKDASNANYFTIENGNFKTFKYVKGKYSVITDETKSSVISSQLNILKIIKKKNKLFYFINNKKVNEEPFDRVMGKNTGFSVWSKTSVNIDYFYIIQDKQSINLSPEIIWENKSENLGNNVNTSANEAYPIISADDSILYFIRGPNLNNIGGKDDFCDIYFAKRNKNGWSPSENIGKPLNNSGANAVCSVTPDGNSLMVINKYDNAGNPSGGGVSMAHNNITGWFVPALINIKDYYNLHDKNEFCLSNDGKAILLAIERNDTWGEQDIYVSLLGENNEWSEPMNIGNVVNTEGHENSPFLASDGVTLYYSSDGLSGYGSNDIFITKRLDNTWKNWTEPVNIGKPINTSLWDAYYSIAASGEYAYYISYENSKGGSDIFRIKLPTAIKPNPVVLVSGTVYNAKTKKPISAKLIYETLPDGINAGNALSNPENGNYKIVLPYGKNYSFRALADQFISISENLNLDSIADYKEITRDLYLVPIEVGQTIRLNNIFFDFGKSVLRMESFPELDRIVNVLKENPTIEIEMSGHTDNVGSKEDNLILSDNRAKEVKKYIVSKGILTERIKALGYGETKPMATNDTEEGRQRNRRVEFIILKK